MISRSGTNTFHGSAFYSGQNEKFNARNFFSSAQQPVGTFHQHGGTLGGPILRSKAFFFATYEGYDENVQQNLNMVVPYKELRRNSAGAAIPRDEDGAGGPSTTDRADRLVAGRRRSPIGRWRGLGTRKRTRMPLSSRAKPRSSTGAASPSPTRGCGPSPWSPGPSWTTPTIVNIRTNRIASLPN